MGDVRRQRTSDGATDHAWLPDPRWLLLAPLGAAAGALVTVTVVVVIFVGTSVYEGSFGAVFYGLVFFPVLAALFGGVLGLVCGLVDGGVLAPLVGRGLSPRTGRRRAAAGAAVTNAVVLVVLLLGLIGWESRPFTYLVIAGASIIAAAVAVWWEGRLALREPWMFGATRLLAWPS